MKLEQGPSKNEQISDELDLLLSNYFKKEDMMNRARDPKFKDQLKKRLKEMYNKILQLENELKDNSKEEPKYLTKDLPGDFWEKSTVDWKIPVSKEDRSIGGQKLRETAFTLQKINYNINYEEGNKDQKAESGRMLLHVRQTLDDEDFTSDIDNKEALNLYTQKADSIWNDGGKDQNELYKFKQKQ